MSRFRTGDLLGWEECLDGKKLVKRLGVLIEYSRSDCVCKILVEDGTMLEYLPYSHPVRIVNPHETR